MLSEEFLEKRQSFCLQLSGNYERTFLQRHTISFFDRKNIFANVYILQSRVLVYMEGFEEKSIKLLAKPRTDIQKVSFI